MAMPAVTMEEVHQRAGEQQPADRDLQRYFGVTPPSVHQMVLTLERAGLIRRKPGVNRSIELLVNHNSLPTLQPNQPVKSSVRRH
jgi:DNA-binding FadR family transcriptional regulator